MALAHGHKTEAALQEPKSRAGVSPASVGDADGTQPLALARSACRRDACPTLGQFRFLLPRKEQKRMDASHEPALSPSPHA
jgi:hypothetical protein